MQMYEEALIEDVSLQLIRGDVIRLTLGKFNAECKFIICLTQHLQSSGKHQ